MDLVHFMENNDIICFLRKKMDKFMVSKLSDIFRIKLSDKKHSGWVPRDLIHFHQRFLQQDFCKAKNKKIL